MILLLAHEFMFFHLGDTYFFMNEIIKTQPTSQEEADLFTRLIKENKDGNRRYGRLVTLSVIIPYMYSCGVYRGYVWKALALYLIYREMDALYDMGMYLNFFIHGNKQMRSILDLDPKTSFSPI
jgi:hypothetical protein